jgi:hypothetical protein
LLRLHTNLDDVDRGRGKICKLEREKIKLGQKKRRWRKKRGHRKKSRTKKGRGKVAEIEKQQERKMEVKIFRLRREGKNKMKKERRKESTGQTRKAEEGD